jgi:hypothetical protein
VKELKDAKGFRSRYINDLNRAVKANRVVGGDVTPIESEAGTLLRINQRNPQYSFQLFSGIAPAGEEGSLINTICVSDGAFYVNGILEKLENGTNAIFCESGIRPRSTGWASKGCLTASSWSECDVVILKYGAQYFLAFRYDSSELYPLISDELTEEAEANIELLYTIGKFRASTLEIVQNVKFDIFYTTEKSKGIQPWQVINRDGQWLIVDPLNSWSLSSTDVLEDVKKAEPSELKWSFWRYSTPIVVDGRDCYPITLAGELEKEKKYLYACFGKDGEVKIEWRESKETKRKPTSIFLGIATIDEESEEDGGGEEGNENDTKLVISSFSQQNYGIIFSEWNETEPFFVMPSTGDAKPERKLEAPKGLEEGKVIPKVRFWQLRTTVNERVYANSEDLNYTEDVGFPEEQRASSYGEYIYRYALHFRMADRTMIIDSETSAVPLVNVEIYAREVSQPFVERIEVVYPDTPLAQGKVNAVGGEVKVLMIGDAEPRTKEIFRTEAVDTSTGTVIEGV